MKIEHRVINDNIYTLTFENQKDLTSTFLRFQEHYESPEFAGKVFSLDEYKEWYTKNSPNGKKTGEFTYYTDWNGFNIPSTIFELFYKGDFNPLSEAEKQILDLFKGKNESFYVIGLNKESKNLEATLKHEIAHGLFFTNPKYKENVLNTIEKYNTDDLKNKLLSMGGYNEKVLLDEVHAYSISGGGKLNVNIPEGLIDELTSLFKEYSK